MYEVFDIFFTSQNQVDKCTNVRFKVQRAVELAEIPTKII